MLNIKILKEINEMKKISNKKLQVNKTRNEKILKESPQL
jgi:hypothetical protein